MRGDIGVGSDVPGLNEAEFLGYLMLATLIALAIPSTHLRAFTSSLLLFILLRVKGANFNLGTIRRSAISSLLALIMTLPFLSLARMSFSGVNPLDIAEMIPFHISVALWEECLYRGPVLGCSLHRFILSSLLFSLLHFQNPGFSFLPFIGIFSAGIFLCLLRVHLGLLSSISFHISWNVCLEHLWGFPTSGLVGPSIFKVEPIGSKLLTGGEFGPEGSVVALAEFTLASAIIGCGRAQNLLRKFYKLGVLLRSDVVDRMDPDVVRAKVLNVLKFITDPEIPINVVDLGLIREMRVEDGRVHIKMVMTAPGCPYSMMLMRHIEESVKQAVPEVEEVRVELVNYPPWTPLDMTEEGREAFRRNYGYDILDTFIQRYGSIENYYRLVRRYLGEEEEG
ncbi:MAG: metal-sulfur cluster assembly factor [Candidatus Korarchaeum sp.]